jgi:hypothetical protein
MTSVTERNGGTITVAPRNEAAQSALVVISHGLGDTAEGFVDVAEVSTTIKKFVNAILVTSITHSRYLVFGKGTALYQVYSTDCSDTTRNNEYGHAHAFVV